MAITIAAIILAIIGFVFYKKQKKPVSSLSRQEQLIEKNAETLLDILETDHFWGLYIDYKNKHLCCKKALELDKEEIVKKIAPKLPLKGCDRPLCHCYYVGLVQQRHKTRRHNFDRREEIRFEDDNDRRDGDERRSGMWEHHDE
ncbi:MAG: hypothetical protein COB62_05455 [Piscirickettsiaceae bacterium]|nr:MAG: hypothetical protein COB62_05455 [Piscirickettsiaceae bacterium]